jgi:hypothetical protein
VLNFGYDPHVDPHRFDASPDPDLGRHHNGYPDPDRHQKDADPQRYGSNFSANSHETVLSEENSWRGVPVPY